MRPLGLRPAVLFTLALGCQGTIRGPVEDRGTPLDDEQRAIDDQQRAANPELFAIATEYFPGESLVPGAKRLFRLTRVELDLTTRTLLPAHYAATALDALPRDPLEKNYEYAANLGFSPANFTPYTSWVAPMVEGVRAAPEGVIDCAADDSPTCFDEQARAFVARAFRGVVNESLLARYSALFESSVAAVGFANATADLVDVALTSPNYVFRDEVLTDPAQLLLPAQRLQNITYTLADTAPEALGLSWQDASEQLATPEAVRQTVEHVLSTAEARAKLVRFFLAWLELKAPDEFGIAASVFPEFTPDVAAAVAAETQAFLEQQLSVATPKLADLTEPTRAFVSDKTSFLYGVPAANGLVDLDPAQRLGVFTLPGVIASHSGPTTTRLVKRGVFFTRKVMCMPLGSPPDGIDTTIPSTAGASERQRIEAVTAPARCAGCHAIINPFGFMQENYDAIGRWRTTDQGVPIDASISVGFLDEGPLTTSTSVDALRGFTRSMRFQQCFTRQLFRYYMGRDETEGDDPLLRQMFFDFANGGQQDIIGMLRTLTSSSVFSMRAEAP
jgi:Protein of unknown function (DUF1588)/Protein of unknown function (DUF1592)/Protein of unknown function (DUF1585)